MFGVTFYLFKILLHSTERLPYEHERTKIFYCHLCCHGLADCKDILTPTALYNLCVEFLKHTNENSY